LLQLAVALAVASAFLHASWNILLKSSGDPLRLGARAMGAAVVIFTPIAVALWLLTGRPWMPWQAWALAAISGALNALYFHLLAAAYRRGQLSSVYPMARGSAPLIAVLVGLFGFREHLSAGQAAGVAAVLLGIWLVRPPRGSRAAVLPALATGLAIAAYTSIDRAGVRLGPFWMYSWAEFAACALLLVPWRGPAPVTNARLVGGLSVGAYSLVLAALALAPLAVIAPLRESSVVLVALWGVFRLGEREGGVGLKLGGAAAVLAGLALLTVG
jgi:drug/metabolite transporter (DMT)-like permease